MKDIALTSDLLLQGYAAGIFPMAESRDDPEVFWVDPKRRGILPLNGFHMSRSLAKAMRRGTWTIAFNRDFIGVVEGCANRADTWINPEILFLYSELHREGHAHSVEVWDGDMLVGGVYGVVLGAAFFGESMFSARANASKIALAAAVDHLARCGFTLFDTQFVTPHLSSLGAIEISRSEYHRLLATACRASADFWAHPPASLQEVVQRMTQTS